MLAQLLLGLTVASALLAFLLHFLALHGWRRSVGAHWSERARALYPAYAGARLYFWLFPLVLVVLRRTYWPQWPDSFLEYFAVILGTTAATWPLRRAVSPDLSFGLWCRETLLSLTMTSFRLALFVWVVCSMPVPFEASALAYAAIYVVYDLWVAFGGLLRWFRTWGLIRDAPERLHRLAAEVCAEMKVPLPKVWAFTSTTSNAYAVFWERALLFADSTLAHLNDAQLKGVIAHELAHLDESRSTRFLRLAGLLATWPWLFLIPLLNAYGPAGFTGLAVWTWLVRWQSVTLSRRMEHRADRCAIEHSPEEKAAYAQALATLHEVNFAPAVIGTRRASHPDLYDRMLAAGVTPDFPRPEAPTRFSLLMLVVALGSGIVLGPHLTNYLDAMDRKHHFRHRR